MSTAPEIASCHIRRATLPDLDRIVQIWNEGAATSFANASPRPDDVRSFFEERLSNQSDAFGIWVVVLDGVVIGWQGLQPCRNNPVSRALMAESSTYVSTTTKVCGMGSFLINHAQDHAKRAGLQYIVGFVLSTNAAAIGIAEAAGWAIVGRMPRRIDDEAELLYMVYAVPE